MEYKWIKDTVHGYIKIEKDFLKIVNTPEFQRLKWIEQGSFRVLYPSARHDRFIHSLGVFGIARECFDALMENLKKDLKLELDISQIEKWKYTFLYAALLHDIGHAPFSHTFESFFAGQHGINAKTLLLSNIQDAIKKLNKDTDQPCDIEKLDKSEVDLLNAFATAEGIDETQIEGFISDFLIEKGGIKPKIHEILSATILLEKYKEFTTGTSLYGKVDLNTAARMVIGCTYYRFDSDEDLYGIENVLIRLLNSSILDVDKLDYIIRDTKMSGYDNVSLDIKRLLRSVTAIKNEEGIYPAYDKKVLSTIDNLFKAKQQENMWMISHPVVEYEKRLIMACVQEYDNSNELYIEKVFTKEALTQAGICYNDLQYRLLSDIDILCDIKTLWNNSEQSVVNEYFNANMRKHPIWKSLYDYRFIWQKNSKGYSLEEIHDFFYPLINHLHNNNIFTFDENVYKEILQSNKEKIISAANIFKKLVTDFKMDFSFSILDMKNDFLSSVNEKNIYIFFDSGISDKNYDTYYGLINENSDDNDATVTNAENNFFYIYSKTKFTPEILKNFVCLTIEEITKNKKKLNNQKRKARA